MSSTFTGLVEESADATPANTEIPPVDAGDVEAPPAHPENPTTPAASPAVEGEEVAIEANGTGNLRSASPGGLALKQRVVKSSTHQVAPKVTKLPSSNNLARREADDALRLAMAATRAADQALQRALVANRGQLPEEMKGRGLTSSNSISSVDVKPLSRSPSTASMKETESKKDEEIVFSGRPFGGLWGDVCRRAKSYLSDWTDGFNSKTISATVLLYFACLAPAIAFGALLEKFTHGDMGAIECILSTFMCGTLYALFSGQPLLILGGTGPVAIFESIMFKVAEEVLGVPFLVMRFWTGIWVASILGICAIFDLCFLIKFITRFTDEIFAALISSIFIYEACKGLLYPLGKSYDTPAGVDTQKDAEHDSATLLSLLLGLGTFLVLLLLRNFRKSKFLLSRVRVMIADFAPIIAIAIMTCIDMTLNDMSTKKLRIPDELQPSKDCRPWVVPLMSYGPELYSPTLIAHENFESPVIIHRENCSWSYRTGAVPAGAQLGPHELGNAPSIAVPLWVPLFSIAPALLASVLLYLDQNITARLINKADNKLKKGAGYHLDMLMLAILIFLSSMIGTPWMCAATVRSINHLMALAEKQETVNAEGYKKEEIVHVCETRLTGFLIHVLIGLSLFAVAILKYVPMAVLLGLFLTMGITSLTSIQLWERIQLLLMDPSLYPPASYVRQVPRLKLHLYTLIQICGLALLFYVKKSPVAMGFPLIILLMVPIRTYLLPRFFNERELQYLDSEEEMEDEEKEEIIDL
mmetsp:Transcript_6805/g.11461  ORF Transcript_6805/g.11461 Transcript_6805/m.11461 type:complete len:755 (+) Transcript_6805:62-2326(+)|eukprot:CAMPEP_0119299230 /NCGR_PEP_ID=MMETSP1333-20130426/1342_1 /TAXON_ID=418940 /ORGANISM="Scyphosphaera apsteinii, Strain RCC1455" /LENGTH=754 /DNA_ID=CAMNT_0007300597 /DNA_START=63 /DNA_END=2327 /DNA_ORIENTATION=+